jgi:hypothetical protein
MGDATPRALGAPRVDEGKLKDHMDEVVRSSVEETLKGLLDAEAGRYAQSSTSGLRQRNYSVSTTRPSDRWNMESGLVSQHCSGHLETPEVGIPGKPLTRYLAHHNAKGLNKTRSKFYY